MSDFRTVSGFEDVWRPPVRARWVRPAARAPGLETAVRARLWRVVTRTPEVMVKVTGRTRDGAHLRAHLAYVTRHGGLEAEGRDGWGLDRAALRDLAEDWSAAAERDPRRRANSPVSHSIVLSMPQGTDPIGLRDAARAFAEAAFADRFDYAFVLHTDTPRPHVHLTVRSLGGGGERLNPKKADLEAWRQMFAEALRARGIAAEATPRRARGVTRKPQRGAVQRLLDRAARGQGELPRVRAGAYREAATAAFQGDKAPRPWETQMVRRQQQIRGLYGAQARLLAASPDPENRRLARQVQAFLADMPPPDSQRLALARELRAANARAAARADERDGPAGKDRQR